MEELPRKLKKREANKTPAIMQWLLDHYPHDVCVEIKYGNNKVKTHQYAALQQVVDGEFKYKIPDTGFRNPFDGIVLKTGNVHSVIVVVEGNDCKLYDMTLDKYTYFRI